MLNKTDLATVNGLDMYYEIHGTGEPLVILHGAYMSIPLMGDIIPRLAAKHQVIAVELQGHGRTADIDRPFSYETMADDVAGLMAKLNIQQADIFGYSMGGGVALQLAMRHPETVKRLVIASASYTTDCYPPGFMEFFETMTLDMITGTIFEADYKRLAPHPENFPQLFEKLVEFDRKPFTWSEEAIQAIQSPTLLIMGDADIITLEYGVKLIRLLGGGKNGDIDGLPESQLAILPGTTHIGVISRVDWLDSMITEFLG